MTHFFSCDWGTSSFRLRLIAVNGLSVVHERSSDQGIAATFNAWQEKASTEGKFRRNFYLDVVRKQLQKIEETVDFSLAGIPILLSGMASSSMGIEELSYAGLPFHVDGSGAIFKYFEPADDLPHPVFLISGVRTAHDVMRGEETQLVGACAGQKELADGKTEVEKVFIFPGTHSKHVRIKDGRITGFKTFMTGEFFDLLKNRSILRHGLADVGDFQEEQMLQSFVQGVNDSLTTNLLNASFRVRTNHLFGYLSKEDNSCYLSGLFIGHELADLIPLKNSNVPLYLVGNSGLQNLYSRAIFKLGLGDNLRQLSLNSDNAVIHGQWKIFENFLNQNDIRHD